MESLLELRRQIQPNSPWDVTLLKKFDKYYKLKGMEHSFTALTGLRMTDPLPSKMHYRPLLRAVLVHRMRGFTAANKFKINEQTGEANFEMYTLTGKVGNFFRKVMCNFHNVEVDIPDDYAVKADGSWQVTLNWSLFDARLKGKTVEKNVYEIFKEAGRGEHFGYDSKSVFDKAIEEVFPGFEEEYKEAKKSLPKSQRCDESDCDDEEDEEECDDEEEGEDEGDAGAEVGERPKIT